MKSSSSCHNDNFIFGPNQITSEMMRQTAHYRISFTLSCWLRGNEKGIPIYLKMKRSRKRCIFITQKRKVVVCILPSLTQEKLVNWLNDHLPKKLHLKRWGEEEWCLWPASDEISLLNVWGVTRRVGLINRESYTPPLNDHYTTTHTLDMKTLGFPSLPMTSSLVLLRAHFLSSFSFSFAVNS